MGIEDYFLSREFIKAIYPLQCLFAKNNISEKESIGILISSGIKYYLLFNNDDASSLLNGFYVKLYDDIRNMRENIITQNTIDASLFKISYEDLVSSVRNNNPNMDSDELNNEVREKIIKVLSTDDFLFHAFNSANLESIKKHGINPNYSNSNQEEINKIDSIYKSYGIDLIFGWQKINCDGKISYSQTPKVSYSYGIRSPEWFSQFVGGCGKYSFLPIEDRIAFEMGDKECAKKNVMELMKKNNFSSEDMESVMLFFEKNWNIYGNNEPLLAVIPVTKNESEKEANMFRGLSYDNSKLFDLMFGLKDMANDIQVDSVLDVTVAKFIRMPRYDSILRSLEEEKNNKTELAKMNSVESVAVRIDKDDCVVWRLSFDYNDDGQVDFVNSIFNDYYLDQLGPDSRYALVNNEFIQPFYDGEVLKEVLIPDFMFFVIIKSLINNNGVTVNIGEYSLSGKYDRDECWSAVSSIIGLNNK